MKKTVLIVDAGGRGAALVSSYAKSPEVGKIIAVPGNSLMQINSNKPVEIYPHLKTTSVKEIMEICKKEKVDLVDVAQDNAVAVGVADALLKEGFNVFGPNKKAGELEWNKAYAREFMAKYNILQPEFFVFSDFEKGIEFLTTQSDQPWFVKASGLCEGKGALPAANNAEAEERIIELKKFGEAGKTFLLEKWIKSEGNIAEEFSAFAISDGNTWQIIGYSQDHKRALDADKGENTGGMGCSTPPLVIDDEIKNQTEEIFRKTFEGMKKEGREYKGILYLGGIIIRSKINTSLRTSSQTGEAIPTVASKSDEIASSVRSVDMNIPPRNDGRSKVYVIEYNARWGDPEAEVIVPGIKNDFYELGMAVVKSELSSIKLKIENKTRISVAVCAKGYPEDYKLVLGKEIFGIEEAVKMPGVIIYGAGITVRVKGEGERVKEEEIKLLYPMPYTLNPKYFVNGGRVLHVVGEGKDILEARQSAYKAVKKISIDGNNIHYRTDIGWRDVQRIRLSSRPKR